MTRRWIAHLVAALALTGAQAPFAHAEPPAPGTVPIDAAAQMTTSDPLPERPSNPNSGCPGNSIKPTRRRPGQPVIERDNGVVECDPDRLPAPNLSAIAPPAAQDRWRIIDKLGFGNNLVNPYATNNPLKGDRPLLD